jgi:hypothetical protein
MTTYLSTLDIPMTQELILFMECSSKRVYHDLEAMKSSALKYARKGIYSQERLCEGLFRVVNTALKEYWKKNCSEQGNWYDLLSTKDRRLVALYFARSIEERIGVVTTLQEQE